MPPVFRVPLLNWVKAVWHRLDIAATASADPPGPASEGFNRIFREPEAYEAAGEITDARQYMTVVEVPCQFEVMTYEERQQVFGGNAPDSEIVLVLHRKQLARLSLIDSTTGNILLKVGDKVTALKYRTRTVLTFPGDGLYIFKLLPASEGMGPDGYDLYLAGTSSRPFTPR